MSRKVRLIKPGRMVESSVESVLTRFEENCPRFEGGRRVEVGGHGRIFAAPPHGHIWRKLRGGLMKLWGMVEDSIESQLTKFEKNR